MDWWWYPLCSWSFKNSKGNFLSFNEFHRKFQINTNFLQYFQLLSAIPTELKTQAREIQHPDLSLDSLASPILKISEAVNVDLKTLRCKNYYKLISEKLTVVPTSFKTWEKQIPEISANWQQAFRRIYAFSKDNRLRQFSFKLLHRIITTKKELKRYNMANDEYCTRCLNPDSIEHTFINCHDSLFFHNRTLGWFNSMHNTEIDLSSNQTSFVTCLAKTVVIRVHSYWRCRWPLYPKLEVLTLWIVKLCALYGQTVILYLNNNDSSGEKKLKCHSLNSWTIGEVSVKCRSSVGQVSVKYRPSIGQVSVMYRSSIDRLRLYRSTYLSVDYRPVYRSNIGRISIDSRPDIKTDRFKNVFANRLIFKYNLWSFYYFI